MKTKGGYEIKNFQKLETPLHMGNLKPMIYRGIIFDPHPLVQKEIELLWNEYGKVSNYQRVDCFIEI